MPRRKVAKVAEGRRISAFLFLHTVCDRLGKGERRSGDALLWIYEGRHRRTSRAKLSVLVAVRLGRPGHEHDGGWLQHPRSSEKRNLLGQINGDYSEES